MAPSSPPHPPQSASSTSTRRGGSELDAVLLLFDDSEHTFNHVASALETLGLPPPIALVLTQEVNDLGLNAVAKGRFDDLVRARDVLLDSHLKRV